MFDDFEKCQKIPYLLLKNSVLNGKISHAYLVDGNGFDGAYDFVMAFVKMIVCDNHYSNFEKCGGCSKCFRIKKSNYTEVKVIEPIGNVIKKEQLLELQDVFSRTVLEGTVRVYVIRDCDKMNSYASNSLLKFLEEPCNNIVAILLTNHINSILSTIVSRCQLIRLVNNASGNKKTNSIVNFANLCCDNALEIETFINDDVKNKFVFDLLDFAVFYEENRRHSIIYLKKVWYDKFNDRDSYIYAFMLLINLYYDCLKCKYSIDSYFFSDHYDVVLKIANLNTETSLINKINVFIEAYENLKKNLNINLLLDDVVIKLGDCDENFGS